MPSWLLQVFYSQFSLPRNCIIGVFCNSGSCPGKCTIHQAFLQNLIPLLKQGPGYLSVGREAPLSPVLLWAEALCEICVPSRNQMPHFTGLLVYHSHSWDIWGHIPGIANDGHNQGMSPCKEPVRLMFCTWKQLTCHSSNGHSSNKLGPCTYILICK